MAQDFNQELLDLLESLSSSLSQTHSIALTLSGIETSLTGLQNDLSSGIDYDPKSETRLSDALVAQEKLVQQLTKLNESHDAKLLQINNLIESLEPTLDTIEFNKLQQLVVKAQTGVLHARQDMQPHKEHLPALEKQIAILQRQPQNHKVRLQVDRMSAQRDHLLSEINKHDAMMLQLTDHLTAVLVQFHSKVDPRTAIERITDAYPFLLLPVRLETRFMIIKHMKRVTETAGGGIGVGGGGPLGPMGGGEEGGGEEEPEEKFMHVSTEFALPQVQPLAEVAERVNDKYELWVRIYPDDIAIHAHEERLTQDELDAATNYWTEVWRAGGNTTLELGAWRVLASAYNSRRAAWIALQTEPTNPIDKPSSPVPEGTPLTINPSLPSITLKPATWSEQPVTRMMPDRFVVRVYTSTTYREVMGLPVPNPLPVGLDPTADYTSLLDQVDGSINMPAELKWLTDFEEAEKVGMGIRIPISADEMDHGFDRLLVLGVRLMADPDSARGQLEDLLDNHHYKSGFALVPQGTPTNNTETVPSGFSSLEPGEETSFLVERSDDLFIPATGGDHAPDGQRFADALGISTSKMMHVYHSNGTDADESVCMNRALWPATMGYYMKQMLSPSTSDESILLTKAFFTEFVHGRGLIPAFRVGKQPYGVLPTTAYSRWKYADPNAYESKLYNNILKPLNPIWEGQTGAVKSVTSMKNLSGDPKTYLVDILGLHPVSLEYYQRFTAGPYLMWNMYRFVSERSLTVDPAFPVVNGMQAIMNNAVFHNLGFAYSQLPRIFDMTFLQQHRLLNGPSIDLLPLSETRTIQKVPATVYNYIQWLRMSTLQQVRTENFTNIGAVAGQKPPQALLYLLLRHACFLQYLTTSYTLLVDAGIMSAEATIDNELLNLVNSGSGPELSEEIIATLRQAVTAEITAANETRIQSEVNRLLGDTGSTTTRTRQDFEQQIRLATQAEVDEAISSVFDDRLEAIRVEQAKWNLLTQPYSELTGEMPMESYIDQLLIEKNPLTNDLDQFKLALDCLSPLPTARLERCMAEHLDTCNYRLDAWMSALVLKRLKEQRVPKPKGIYLGAYSMLEEVRPGSFPGIHVKEIIEDTDNPKDIGDVIENPREMGLMGGGEGEGDSVLPPLEIETLEATTFQYLGSDPFTQLMDDSYTGTVIGMPRIDPDNQGYILAPSLNHAVTAAILRAGYIAHRNTASNDDALAVNLTSARVRKALYYLEGIRNGNSLDALLGYQFERGLHDVQSQTVTNYNLDQYILDIRLKYPLVAGGVVENTSVTEINDAEARHVTNGLALIEAFRRTTAPFWDDGLTIASGSKTVIEAEIEKITADMDAIGDLLLSESVFQTARGNNERAGAVLKALGEGNHIPEPEIVRTPRMSNVLTHRFAIQLNPNTASPTVWTISPSARSFSEPALNSWLAVQLPNPSHILIRVEYTDMSDVDQVENISITDLYVEPIDLLAMFMSSGNSNNEDAAELSARITYFVRQTNMLDDDREVHIVYNSRSGFTSADRSIFELLPLFRALQQLISNSRALTAEDLLLPSEADGIIAGSTAGVDTTALLARLTDAVGPAVTTGHHGLNDVWSALGTAEAVAEALSFPTTVTTELDNLRDQLVAATAFGITGSFPVSATDDSEAARDLLVGQSKLVKAELNRRYTLGIAKLTSIGALSDEREKAKALAELAQIVFGRAFKVYPQFTFHNPGDYTVSLSSTSLLSGAGDFPFDEWMQGESRVRPSMNRYRKIMLLAEAVTGRGITTHDVVQFPLNLSGTDRWLGLEIPEDYDVAGDTLSVVMELPAGYSASLAQCGMLVDEWTEDIPLPNAATGIAMHYNQPNNEAPQSVLLAVTPEIKGKWLWNDLMDTLYETLDMAKKRAVEPDQLQKTILSQVLPAVMAPVSGTASSPGLDFGRNIIQAPAGQSGPIFLDDYPAL